MLTIKNYNTITMQTIELSNKDLYQIDYINEYEGYYKIGLSNPFKGIGYEIQLIREVSLKGPRPMYGTLYYEMKSELWKKQIYLETELIKNKTKFISQLGYLLEVIQQL